jgi:hypothetical protein
MPKCIDWLLRYLTATWTAQQLREAFPENGAPGHLAHEGDAALSA